MDDRTIVFWDCDDGAETLYHRKKDEAIEAYLDNLDREEWKGTATVYGYAPMTVPKPTMENAVDLVDGWFEMNWEEFQGDDGPDTSNSTVEAALEFLTVLHKDFTPWACEVITSEEIDVAVWIAAERPGWLKENKHGQEETENG